MCEFDVALDDEDPVGVLDHIDTGLVDGNFELLDGILREVGFLGVQHHRSGPKST